MPAHDRTLRRWNQLTDFIEIICWTAHVKDGRPQSIVLVSDPGEGKTQLLERFRPNTQLAFYSDATYQTVLTVLKECKRGVRSHLVLTELQKITARKKDVAMGTLSVIMQAMEEGVNKVAFGPYEEDFHGVRMGLIAATTLSGLHRNPAIVTELQMDSRSYFIDARGSRDELMEIERRIAVGDMRALKPIVLKDIPVKPIDVFIPEAQATVVRGWMREMEAAKVPTYKLRTYWRALYTLKGVVLKNQRQRATRADVEELYAFKRLWLNLPPMPVATTPSFGESAPNAHVTE